MEDITTQWVVLKVFQKRQLVTPPIQLQVNKHVSRNTIRKHFPETLGAHLDVPVFRSSPINDRGDKPFPAHTLEHTTTGALTVLCLE